MVVDSARRDEAPFLADCWRAMLEELHMAPGGFVPGWRERLVRFFAAGMEAGSQGWFVARGPGGAPFASAGVLIAETSMIQVQRMATIAGVYVDPAHRRNGTARRLTEAAIAWARERGCTLVRLSASEPAETLYRDLGFERGRELVLRLR
jgi:GNAT superfamily N-acetyltransferase